MSPTVSRGSDRAAPAAPGSRWPSPRCALNTCVTRVAPASAAASTWLASASVWPTETLTPAAVSVLIAAIASGSSGAIVTIVSASADSLASSVLIAAGVGGHISSGRCTPGRSGDRNGPSRCTPSTLATGSPRSFSRARAPRSRPSTSASSGAVMKVG